MKISLILGKTIKVAKLKILNTKQIWCKQETTTKSHDDWKKSNNLDNERQRNFGKVDKLTASAFYGKFPTNGKFSLSFQIYAAFFIGFFNEPTIFSIKYLKISLHVNSYTFIILH